MNEKKDCLMKNLLLLLLVAAEYVYTSEPSQEISREYFTEGEPIVLENGLITLNSKKEWQYKDSRHHFDRRYTLIVAHVLFEKCKDRLYRAKSNIILEETCGIFNEYRVNSLSYSDQQNMENLSAEEINDFVKKNSTRCSDVSWHIQDLYFGNDFKYTLHAITHEKFGDSTLLGESLVQQLRDQ